MSVYKRGNVYWTKFRVSGQLFRQSLKTSNRREATDLERDAIEQARKKVRPQTDDFALLPFHLEGDQLGALEEYLRDRKPEWTPSTQRSEFDHSRPLADFFGPTPVNGIAAARVREYIATRNRAGKANATVNKELGILIDILERAKVAMRALKIKGRRHYSAWQIAGGEIEKLPVRTSKIARVLEHGDKLRLLKMSAANENWSLARRAMLLSLNTTMRAGEIRNLQWRDVNWLDRSVIVRRGKTEESQREIPLNREAYAVLDAMRKELKPEDGAAFVFFSCPPRGECDLMRPMTSWRSAWRALTRAIECPECGQVQSPGEKCANKKCRADLSKLRSPLHGLRFHDLRHQAITELSEGQASDETIMSIAGHIDRRMMSHYSHVRKAARRAALDRLCESAGAPEAATQSPEESGHSVGHNQEFPGGAILSQIAEKNGGDDGTRTRDLCRDRAAF